MPGFFTERGVHNIWMISWGVSSYFPPLSFRLKQYCTLDLSTCVLNMNEVFLQIICSTGRFSLVRRRLRRICHDGRLWFTPLTFLLFLALLQFGAFLRQHAAHAQRQSAIADQRVLRVVSVDKPPRAVTDLRVDNVANLVDGSCLLQHGLNEVK